MAVQIAETDVAAVVSEAVRSIESQDGQDAHRFVVALEDEPLAAEADGDKLGQVLAHLLDNAIRYSPAGGTVTVAARRKADAVEVSVEDEGVGIPHAEQERIFRKFYRGDAAVRSRRCGGHGPRPVPRRRSRHRDGRQDLGRLGRRSWLDVRARAARR